MDVRSDTSTLDVDHLASACDCPVHPQVESLLAELRGAKAEVRRLRRAAPTGLAAPGADAYPAPAPRAWRSWLRLRHVLSWALAESE